MKNPWIEQHNRKNQKKNLKVELVFTDCASGTLIVDEFSWGCNDEFIFTAPFELIMESILLHDDVVEIWSDCFTPPIHMKTDDELRVDFTGMGVWP